MAVRGEPLRGLHAVLVDDAQIAEAHVRRVVVVAEGERVERVEPAEVEMPTLGGTSNGDHGIVLVAACRGGYPSAGARRRHISTPIVTIHTSRIVLAVRLMSIAVAEKPV